jgi:phosphate transport system permease protein
MANELLSPLDAVQSYNAGSTLTVSLYMYAKERGDFETAFAVAAVLLFISVIINVSVKIAKNKFKRGEEK